MTSTILQAKERVVRSLLNRVSVFDEKLSQSDATEDIDALRKNYISQTRLLYRIEKLVTD
tara:strand:+ start:137 stop:316 length:180 start_codon:yes stop_codon:yes gene_type:complete